VLILEMFFGSAGLDVVVDGLEMTVAGLWNIEIKHLEVE
jgi:hypothetical protein